jgi:PadR family transcriptional regulator PadR
MQNASMSLRDPARSVSKELVAASSSTLILSLLRREETYGYAIIKQIRALSHEQLIWTDGMLF